MLDKGTLIIACMQMFTWNRQRDNRRTAARTSNMGFAIAGVACFADIFVQSGSSVLRMKFSAKTLRHRKPLKRYPQPYGDRANINREEIKQTYGRRL